MERHPDRSVVRLLGPLAVTVAGRTWGPRDLGGIKPRQLLEILLLDRGRVVPKDRIADDLWGEHLPRSTSATVETYVSLLRRKLGRSLIVTETGGYRVPREVVDTDLDRFDALLAEAAVATGSARRAALRAALTLGSDELLADEPYAPWVLGPREHHRARRQQAQVDLAECALGLGELVAAVAAAEEVLADDPGAERAARVAMSAHHRRGDTAAALRVHDGCREALADTLGVAPSSATTALCRAITRGVAEPAQDRAVAPVRYADNGGTRIAYQVVGAGPPDLVFVPSFVTNLGVTWDDPTYASFLRRLAGMSRLVLFDKRGTGLSDPVVDPPSSEERVADMRSVLDAAGIERAVLFGVCGGGSPCIRFAAEHPNRTLGLILFGAAAKILRTDDYPWGWTYEQHERFLAAFEQAWLTGGTPQRRNPGLAGNPRYRDWFARYVRLAASPFTARQLAEANARADVRELLPGLRVPCLVLVREHDVWLHPGNSRYLAAHIPGARLLELPGVDHDPWVGDTDAVLAAIGRFLRRAVQRPVVATNT
jgi:pimeloyl-ACP methyl ester carboxylesterase/DNA-binding SARP family transcriptional activator